MAFLTTCRFCDGDTINHDQDDCAKAFGERLGKEVLKHFELQPTKPLPKQLQDVYSGREWKWFLEYRERKETAHKVATHANEIKACILDELGKILATKENNTRIEQHNTPCGSTNFKIKITFEVVVAPEMVF